MRLRNISKWHEYTGTGSAIFGLVNADGTPLSREAYEGDYFFVDLPGPVPAAGQGVEWVYIERLVTSGSAGTPEEFVLMQDGWAIIPLVIPTWK